MIEDATAIATMIAAVGSGFSAGVLLAFSISVMPALRTRPSPEGIAAMQRVNVAIVNPIFLVVFFGSAAAALVAAIGAVVSMSDARLAIVVGCALYVVGCVSVTIAVNVPLNDALGAVDPKTPEGSEVWAGYLERWTRWNHVRTSAAAVGCAVLTFSVGV